MEKEKTGIPPVTVIGASLIDILCRGVPSTIDFPGSFPMDWIRMECGGDALNEALLLHKLKVPVHLISKIGTDMAGTFIDTMMEKEGLDTTYLIRSEDPQAVNIVLVDKEGERTFLTDPQSTLRTLSLSDLLPLRIPEHTIVSFASLFVSRKPTWRSSLKRSRRKTVF